jgi:hypothetical protein
MYVDRGVYYVYGGVGNANMISMIINAWDRGFL